MSGLTLRQQAALRLLRAPTVGGGRRSAQVVNGMTVADRYTVWVNHRTAAVLRSLGFITIGNPPDCEIELVDESGRQDGGS